MTFEKTEIYCRNSTQNKRNISSSLMLAHVFLFKKNPIKYCTIFLAEPSFLMASKLRYSLSFYIFGPFNIARHKNINIFQYLLISVPLRASNWLHHCPTRVIHSAAMHLHHFRTPLPFQLLITFPSNEERSHLDPNLIPFQECRGRRRHTNHQLGKKELFCCLTS